MHQDTVSEPSVIAYKTSCSAFAQKSNRATGVQRIADSTRCCPLLRAVPFVLPDNSPCVCQKIAVYGQGPSPREGSEKCSPRREPLRRRLLIRLRSVSRCSCNMGCATWRELNQSATCAHSFCSPCTAGDGPCTPALLVTLELNHLTFCLNVSAPSFLRENVLTRDVAP